MKRFNRLLLGIIVLFIVLITIVNLFLSSRFTMDSGRKYQVEINRLENEIRDKGIENINLNQYRYVFNISMLQKGCDKNEFFEGNGFDYAIKMIDGTYYRFDYKSQQTDEANAIRWSVNLALLLMVFTVVLLLLYIKIKILRPFDELKEVPYELSRGNLTTGLKENRSRFFGHFVWGLDLLREYLEEQKQKELSLQREKKTLVLAISHDIKTPLSAIKLYTKALQKNLYDSEEKRAEIIQNIGASADKIEGFVTEIMKASTEDFLQLNVNTGEYYLDELIGKIDSFYTEKLSLLKTRFTIQRLPNCILKGDIDRAEEVLQNIMENAIKYGDGTHISIQISSEEDCKLITITNSGCTLSEKELPYLFDSFWRGSNAGSHSGNGLGLYICRQLMRKMDGDIYAQIDGTWMKVTSVFRMI